MPQAYFQQFSKYFILSNNQILTSELENKKPITDIIYVESHEPGANGNFTCQVTFGGKTVTGLGHPKKRAKQEAASKGMSINKMFMNFDYSKTLVITFY